MPTIAKSIYFLLPIVLLILVLTHFTEIRDSFLPSKPKNHPLRDEYIQWSVFFNRTFASEAEFELRFNLWRKSRKFVEKHNSDKTKTHKVALNHFADRTKEEIQVYTSGHHHSPHERAKVNLRNEHLNASQLPASVDWRTKNAVTPIKNQGECGGCWAFSTIAGIEGLYAIKNGSLKVFSEQHLMDCSHLGSNNGCAGGDPETAYDFSKTNGMETAAEYPYVGVDEKCHQNLTLPKFITNGYVQVPQNDNIALAAAVAQQPVSICIDAEQPDFIGYTSGIYQSSSCTTYIGHCVAIVGYGTEDGIDYWIVKNSYGTTWGEEGYIRMIKQSEPGPGICGITLEAVYPVSL